MIAWPIVSSSFRSLLHEFAACLLLLRNGLTQVLSCSVARAEFWLPQTLCPVWVFPHLLCLWLSVLLCLYSIDFALQCCINYAQDKCLLIVYVVLTVSACPLTCWGSETVILTSTFRFLISHTGLWYMTCHCFQGMLKLLAPFFIKVYSHCIAKLSRKKASPFLWVSITKDASYIAGILPFWWFCHSMSLLSCVAAVFFPSQMT